MGLVRLLKMLIGSAEFLYGEFSRVMPEKNIEVVTLADVLIVQILLASL